MADQDIRVEPPEVSLEGSDHLLLILADNHALIGAPTSELLEEEGAIDAMIAGGFELHLIIITEEVADAVEMEFIDVVSVKQLLLFQLQGHDGLDGDAHDPHIGRTLFLTDRFNQLRILDVRAKSSFDIPGIFMKELTLDLDPSWSFDACIDDE